MITVLKNWLLRISSQNIWVNNTDLIENPRRRAASNLRLFSKLEIIFCVFLAENNFVNTLIPFIGVEENS
jgi:hypothetical protein